MTTNIKKKVKVWLKDYPYVIRFLLYSKMSFKLHTKYILKKVKYYYRKLAKLKYRSLVTPTVLQFPITYKCNFDCIMCGMQKMKNKDDLKLDDLSFILNNKLFNKIESVGINGGEPFLLVNIDEYIRVLIKKLPSLRDIYIITNGYLTDKISNKLEVIKKECKTHHIKLYVSISIDGIGDIQDKMRGRTNIFSKVENTCKAIAKSEDKYCDGFGVICTITKENIYNLNEVEVWAKQNGISVSYNIATINKRLNNEDRFENFSVLTDEHAKSLATEWFYCKFRETFSEKYYALYRYLEDGIRLSNCDYKSNGVTLLPDGNIAYCATYSKVLGNGIQQDSEKLYFENQSYKNELLNLKCGTCSHYSSSLTLDSYLEYIEEILDIVGKPFKFRTRGGKL